MFYCLDAGTLLLHTEGGCVQTGTKGEAFDGDLFFFGNFPYEEGRSLEKNLEDLEAFQNR